LIYSTILFSFGFTVPLDILIIWTYLRFGSLDYKFCFCLWTFFFVLGSLIGNLYV